ncbi:EipA family protein [uncultured Bartonella sp.]|uniref:DUF1134 domain-containing protein n=1 Tax=uncultured Bartonella sp. TaxID=104108 RepID=UPI0025DB5BA5|nr:EipA family protein [uncultured Bartonella sp.]
MTGSIRIQWRKVVFLFALALFTTLFATGGLTPSQAQSQQQNGRYTAQEIIDSGHRFFGDAAGSMATAIEKVFAKYGLPNGYILGEEGSGAIIGGLTYGEGTLYTKNVGDHKVFWQGPTIGWDIGGQGSRLMILVYELDSVNNLWGRYAGISGSAYFVAGVGFHVLKKGNILLVPVRTGVGARLGVNIGYLKLTPAATWNPF